MTENSIMPSTQDVRSWLTERIAFYLEMPEADVDPDLPLVDIGLDSVYSLTLCGDVEERFDLLVEPTMAWDHPTISKLAVYLHGELSKCSRDIGSI